MNRGVFGIHQTKLASLGNSGMGKYPVNPLWQDAIRDVGFQSVRGPDGSPANYYLYDHTIRDGQTGVLLASNLPGVTGAPSTSFEYTVNNLNGNQAIPGFTVEDAYGYSNNLGIPYHFAVNVRWMVENGAAKQVTTGKIIQQIRDMRTAANQEIIYVELGNEIYDNTTFRCTDGCEWSSCVVVQYLDTVRPMAQAIYNEFNSGSEGVTVKVALVAKNSLFARQERESFNRPSNFNGGWNHKISSEIKANPQLYHAIVPHEYFNIEPDFMRSNFYDDDVTMSTAFARNMALEQEFEYWAGTGGLFPNKEIWVTEHGTLASIVFWNQNSDEKARLQFSKTPGMALVNMDRALSMLTDSRVTYAHHHSLVDSQGFGVLQQASDALASDKLITLPQYYTYKELGSLLGRYTHIYDVPQTVGGVRQTDDHHGTWLGIRVEMSDIRAVGFGDEGGVKEILLLNRTKDEVTVAFDNFTAAPIMSYGGSNPLPGLFANELRPWSAAPEITVFPKTLSGGFSSSVVVQPYSMAVVSAAQKSFSDVAENSHEALLASKNIIPQITANLYEPNKLITRGEFAVMLADTLRIAHNYDTSINLTQVIKSDSNYWMYAALVNAKVLNANFDPSGPMLVQEAQGMLERAAQWGGISYTNSSFPTSGSFTRTQAAQALWVLIELL